MAIGYDVNAGFVMVSSEYCPVCEAPLSDDGCDAPGCHGLRCPDCGWGCDRGFPQSRCEAAIEAESDEDYNARVDAERAGMGLPPLGGPRAAEA